MLIYTTVCKQSRRGDWLCQYIHKEIKRYRHTCIQNKMSSKQGCTFLIITYYGGFREVVWEKVIRWEQGVAFPQSIHETEAKLWSALIQQEFHLFFFGRIKCHLSNFYSYAMLINSLEVMGSSTLYLRSPNNGVRSLKILVTITAPHNEVNRWQLWNESYLHMSQRMCKECSEPGKEFRTIGNNLPAAKRGSEELQRHSSQSVPLRGGGTHSTALLCLSPQNAGENPITACSATSGSLHWLAPPQHSKVKVTKEM